MSICGKSETYFIRVTEARHGSGLRQLATEHHGKTARSCPKRRWPLLDSLYGNIFFRIKVVLLIGAGLNAFLFHASPTGHNLKGWDLSPVTPFRARLAGSLSLVLWTGIITAGRMIAYNWFN